MKDVHSDVLYTQMKGRGCRVISDDKLKEVTPNADTKMEMLKPRKTIALILSGLI